MSEEFIAEKDAFLFELRGYHVRLSRQDKPDLELIGKLRKFIIMVEMANQDEFDEYITIWNLAEANDEADDA